eukprot:1005391-Pyramimonas_sp.AAC.2
MEAAAVHAALHLEPTERLLAPLFALLHGDPEPHAELLCGPGAAVGLITIRRHVAVLGLLPRTCGHAYG